VDRGAVQAQIDEMVWRIIVTFALEQVIPFGSYARGGAPVQESPRTSASGDMRRYTTYP
jgi:hypothetical protein